MRRPSTIAAVLTKFLGLSPRFSERASFAMVIEVRAGSLEFRADGVVHARFRSGEDIDREMVREMHDRYIEELSPGERRRVPIDLREVRSF